ncbi:PAS domain S-box protein [Sphingomonas piscis]|uniref:histidine kinase n=1 Tax=Sphingomonas piscis TaxID=2714943 RepID=A0A6G7YNP1_9SPHN|nr:PAS domain S-box protein [Sphingomonas piscis]QIK78365.1 PAS domain S-box protein [Sphingomonas piscis]
MNEYSDIEAAGLQFLEDGGECGALIAARDWSTSLGDPRRWPQSLKTATSLLLRSPVPIVMLWGEDGIMLYNDAYSMFAGGRHPELLGSKVREGWPEVADFNDNVMKIGLAGGTLQYSDQELTLYRHGRPEQVWMNLDYSPVIDESGKPAGVLAIVVETTERVAAEHALRERESRLRFFDELGQATRALADPFEIMAVTARMLGQHMHASVCAYADMDEDEDGFTIRGDWAAPGSKSIVGKYKLVDFGDRAVTELHAGRPLITRDTLTELGPEEGEGLLSLGLKATVCMPFIKAGKLTALMAVHQAAPRNWTDADLALISEATERSWAYIERTRSEAFLRESESRFRNMADNSPMMVWVTDPTGFCNYLNRRWYEYTGQEEGEGEGFGWLKAVHPDDLSTAEKAFVSANAEQRDYRVEFRLRRADGSYRWVIDAAAARVGADGTFLGYIGSVFDIDERREAEERLAFHEEQLRLAIDAAEIGLWDVDLLQDTLYWPPRLKQMFGIDPDVPVSMADFYNGLHPDDRETTLAAFQTALDPALRALYDVEYRTIGKEDGVVRWVAAKGRGFFDEQGRCIRALGTAIEITDRKKAEQHQRLLIDELSHRAKNLLAIVQSVAHQTFRGEGSPDEMRKAFEGRIGALGAAHSVLTQQKWESAPVRQIICDTVFAVASNLNRLNLDGPELTLSPKTAVSLAMAIHELATNALKYGALSNDSGTVEVAWSTAANRLRFEWRERGGPPVEAPERRGFGSRMIERGLSAELGGTVKIHFEPQGVVCIVDAPLPESGN